MRVIITQPGTSPRSEWSAPLSLRSPGRSRDAGDHQANMPFAQATNAIRVPKFFTVSSFLVFRFMVDLFFGVLIFLDS